MSDRNAILKEITEISFTADDLTLYLDTHPLDASALEARQMPDENPYWNTTPMNLSL